MDSEPQEKWPVMVSGKVLWRGGALLLIWRYLVVGALLAVAPSYAMACSCNGTASIGQALSNSEDVIVGRVLSTTPATFDGETSTPEGVEIEVVKALKGDLQGRIFVATMSMCYLTFDASHFKPGETYVLPLVPPYDWGGGADAISMLPTPSTEPQGRWFELPGCSHSALALIDGRLYTNEAGRGGLHLVYYMSLTMLERLLPLGLLNRIPTGALVLFAVVVPIAILWRRRSQERRARMEAK